MSVMRKLRRKSHDAKYRVEPLRQNQSFLMRKMSEVILDFAEPLLDAVNDDEHFKNVICFATICWNISFFPEREQQVHLNALADELGKSDAFTYLEAADCVRMLLERKRTLFADDRRMIMDYTIVGEKDHQRLLVASALAKD